MNLIKSKKQTNSRSKGFEADDKNALESALKNAFRLLGYRDRSEKEMLEKLMQKGFSAEVAGNAVAYLKNRGFIDDRRFAGILKKTAAERKHLGRSGTLAYLINKGISGDIADEILGDEDDYLDTARNLIEKKMRSLKSCDGETIKRRLWGMLARRGFSYGTINKALKSFDLKEE
ncbi:MAG: regulatory protein RecX [Nitrospirae bacterium]|nr:regulatory protein RecX [Nitrospirota bacterium]